MSVIAQRVVERFRKQAGADEFSVFVPIADPKRAFEKAVADATDRHGYESYSGTIKEKQGFKVMTRTPMSQKAAYDYAAKHDDDDKWGPALAVPIGEVKQGKPQKVILEIETDREYDVRYKAEAKARDEAAKTYFSGKNVTVKYISSERARGTKPKTKRAPFDKASVFWWERSKGNSSGRTYKSRQEAVDAFQGMPLEAFRDGEVWTLYERNIVTAVIVSGGASTKWYAIVEITPEESVGDIKGWYFYGIASS